MRQAAIVTTKLTAPAGRHSASSALFQPEREPVEREVVNLYPNKRYQTWEGFGGAVTEAAGYAFSLLTPEQRKEAVRICYSAQGLGYTLGRVPVDSADFALGQYCALRGFAGDGTPQLSLEREAQYLQPLLRAVQAQAPELRLLYSPWSPPAEWKTNQSRTGGGHLLRERYQDYAGYLAEYLLAHKKLGFPVAALSVQNEAGAVQIWDSCLFTPQEEQVFLRDFLHPALRRRELGNVQLFIWDHNKERVYERACAEVDESTRSVISGVAYHWYSGSHFESLRLVSEDFPNLKLWRTEGCIELVGDHKDDGLESAQAERYLHELIGDMNGGMSAWFDWNLMLDQRGGPNYVGNFCGAPLRCDRETGRFSLSKTYDAIWHCSHFIRPGARRIGLTRYLDRLEAAAFQNPDGQIAVVLMNSGEANLNINLRLEGQLLALTLEAATAATILISGQ